jgi:CHASE2 domain-containing sensor protein
MLGNRMSFQAPLRALTRDLARGAVLTVLITMANAALEHNWWVEQFRRVGYESIQRSLNPPSEETLDQVALFDISRAASLERTEEPASGDPRHLTPRKALKTLIRNLDQAGATGIVVDIDFSMEGGTWRSRDDPDLMQFSKSLHKPVLLGVYSAEGNEPSQWLGPDFVSLAVGISFPRGDLRHSTYKVDVEGYPQRGLLNLAPQLAKRLETEKRRDIPRLVKWAVRDQFVHYEGDRKPRLMETLFPVDYSAAQELRKRVHVLTTTEVSSQDASGRVAFVGDFEGPDQHPIPNGDGTEVIPGTILHALAYLSLVVDRRLWELSPLGRFALDLALVSSGLILAGAVRLYYLKHFGKRVHIHKLEHLWYAVVAAAVVLAACWWVGKHRVIWDDYLWVALLLFFHPTLEEYFWPAVGALGRRLRTSFRGLVVEEPEPKSEPSTVQPGGSK